MVLLNCVLFVGKVEIFTAANFYVSREVFPISHKIYGFHILLGLSATSQKI
jgi:hypothetical protein